MSLRESLLQTLTLLGDFEAQRKYVVDVPIADVPAELICMWFDDVYHPDTRLHNEAFSIAEQDLLASFHATFEARVERLPTGGSLEELHGCTHWQEIAGLARRTAAAIRAGAPKS